MFLKQWRAVIAPIFFGSKIREIFLEHVVNDCFLFKSGKIT